jgi:hypothetical protein
MEVEPGKDRDINRQLDKVRDGRKTLIESSLFGISRFSFHSSTTEESNVAHFYLHSFKTEEEPDKTDRQMYRSKDRYPDKQIKRQTDRDRQRQTETDTQREIKKCLD